MKKIIKAVLVCFMVLGLMNLPTKEVKALDQTGILKSFAIQNFNNGNITANTYYDYEYELNKEVDKVYFNLYYMDEDNNLIDYGRSFGGKRFIVDEIFKWINENYKFVFLNVYYEIGDACYDEYYSHLTKEQISVIDKDGYFYFEDLKEIENTFDFTLTDYDKDTEGPTFTLTKFEQDGYKVNFAYTAEDKSYVNRVKFTFENGMEYTYYEFGNKQYGTIDLLNYFPNYVYGTYKIQEVTLYDAVGNESVYSDFNQSVVLSEENNPLEKIPSLTASIETEYADGKMHFRKGSGVGSDCYYVRYYDGDTRIYNYNGYIDKFSEMDFSTVGSKTFSFTNHEITITPGKTHTINYEFEAVVEEVVGELLIPEAIDLEICLTYEQYINKEFNQQAPHYIPVKLNDGTIILHKVLYSAFGTAPGVSSGIPYYLEGYVYAYNPKYKGAADDDEWYETRVSLNVRYYIQDKYGNLLDNRGNVLVTFAERVKIIHETLNDLINISSTEGDVPTYAEISATEVDVKDIFDTFAIAYDINMVANEENVQPLNEVEVTISLPEDLQDKEVEVYYVDDNGKKTKHDCHKSNDGKSVTFETDHFSTYAVVEKNTCAHTTTKLENVVEATCKTPGYTGDEVCDQCGQPVSQGQATELDKDNHEGPTHVENEKEASCKEEGYTGDEVCEACGEVAKKGTTIKKSDHDFDENDICTECGKDKSVIDTADTNSDKVYVVLMAVASLAGLLFIRKRKTC